MKVGISVVEIGYRMAVFGVMLTLHFCPPNAPQVGLPVIFPYLACQTGTCPIMHFRPFLTQTVIFFPLVCHIQTPGV
jgi:hypothetical protein